MRLGPGGRCIHLAVGGGVVGGAGAEADGEVDVDEVAEEEHELRVGRGGGRGEGVAQVFKTGEVQCVRKGVVGEEGGHATTG